MTKSLNLLAESGPHPPGEGCTTALKWAGVAFASASVGAFANWWWRTVPRAAGRGWRRVRGFFRRRADGKGVPGEGTTDRVVEAAEKYLRALQARGRVVGWGLCVGITYRTGPYGGRVPALAGCDGDARKMTAALGARGIECDCLTDEAATIAAVTSRLAALAAKSAAHPGKPVWIFFSIHGVQGRPDEANRDETDLRQEYLVLADRLLLDDRFKELVFAISPASPVVVVLDACYSGGLRRELCDSGRKVHLFASSSEYRTSEVAPELGLGGYMTACVLGALRDTRGPITAGQLEDYLEEKWAGLCRHRRSDHTWQGRRERGVRQWKKVELNGPCDEVVAGG